MCTGGGRGGQIRTDDFLLPKQALYQAELREDEVPRPGLEPRTHRLECGCSSIELAWRRKEPGWFGLAVPPQLLSAGEYARVQSFDNAIESGAASGTRTRHCSDENRKS